MQFYPDAAETLRARLRIVKRLEQYPNRVVCPVSGCSWSCPCRDLDDAEHVLLDHVHAQHHEPDAA